jgi:hypothetical protein
MNIKTKYVKKSFKAACLQMNQNISLKPNIGKMYYGFKKSKNIQESIIN